MGDQEFNFPPSQRREPKRFEPPPWERDAFEELSRAKAAQQAAAEAEARAELEAAAAKAATRVAAGETDVGQPPAAEMLAGAQEAASEGPAVRQQGEGAGATDQAGVSEARLTEMLAGLRAEEPTSMQTYGVIAIALSVFTGLVGIVMLVWAMAMFVSAAARGTGRVGMISGSIVAFFGALFIGLSMWVAVRTLRQRGVL